MFTEEAVILVDVVFEVAKGTIDDRPWAYEKVEMVGKTEGFEEATDNKVRVVGIDASGYENDTPFYI